MLWKLRYLAKKSYGKNINEIIRKMKHKEKEDNVKNNNNNNCGWQNNSKVNKKHARIKVNSTWFTNVIKVVDDHFDNNFHAGLWIDSWECGGMNIQITTIVQEEAKGWGERRNKGDIYNVTHEMH